MITKPICNKCKHFCLNHGNGTGMGCRAFPKGIPNNVMFKHFEVISGQVGEFVFEEVEYEELPPYTKWMWDKARELGLD